MRKFFVVLFAVVVACCLSSPAVAINLIYEPFDYTPPGAALLGQINTSPGTAANGNSWLRTGTNAGLVAPTQINVGSGSLTGPSELKASIGNDVTMTGNGGTTGPADRLSFVTASGSQTTTITSGTIYYSFLLRVDALTGANNVAGDYFLTGNNTANATTPTYPTVVPGQFRARIDPNDPNPGSPTQFSLGMFTQRTPTQGDSAWVNGLIVGQTNFIVGAFNVGASNSTRLWINPDPLTFGLPTAPVTDTAHDNTSGSSGGTIGSILLHQRTAPWLTLDELRVSTSWQDVTPLGAATSYWDIDGATAGAGGATPSGTWDGSTTNWNSSANGDASALTWNPGSAAVFSAGGDATGLYTVTVSGTQSATQVTFEDGTVTLTGGTLNLTGSLHTISVNSGVTATIDSVVGGAVGFIKDGSGTLVLTNANTYAGATTINSGTLQMGNGGITGSLPTSSAITTNATLSFNQSDTVTQGVDFGGAAITGTGGVTQAGSGTLALNAANTFSGTTRAAAGTLHVANSLALQNSLLDLNVADSGAVVVDSSLSAATVGALGGSRSYALVNGASAALALTVGNANGTYSGALSGSGSLTKAGAGTQTLSGSNTYAGGTTISGGTLQFSQTVSMPASGAVTVNSGGTLGVNAGGAGEWTNSAVVADPASIAGLIAGTGGQGTPNQVTWNAGSILAIDTTNAGGSMIYTGNIGNFRTTGGGTTNAVGFTKRGSGTLELQGTNTFSGQLSIAGNSGTLLLTGTSASAGTTMAIPTVGIGSNSTLQLGISNSLPSGTLINTQGPSAQMFLQPTFTQTIRSLSGNNGVVTVQAGATLTIADQAGDNYVFGNGVGTANLRSEDTAIVDKTGAGTLTLFGDNGNNFNGHFIMRNGRLNLSRNQALGTGATGRITVMGGQLGRSNTTANFTYSPANLDVHVFRYDLSDAPTFTSQIGATTLTTLKQNDVEINITNGGAQTGTSGRFNFLGDIRNHDPSPFGGDDPNAIRGITKKGNGVLALLAINTYKGATTVEDGVLLLSSTSTLGDANGTVNLKGGLLATADNRTTPIENPVVVDGSGAIGFFGSGGQTSVVMEFNDDSVVGTSGSLTLVNANSSTTVSSVFRPRFTGKDFNFALPIVISDAVTVGSGVKSNELQSGNTTGTQTFSGPISGGGSLRRTSSGGTTILSGNNTFSGGTFVDDGTLTASGASATLGGGNVTVIGGNLEIASGVSNAIANSATLSLAGGGAGGVADVAFANLGAGINEQVLSLILGGATQANGTYGSTLSTATNQLDEFFLGTGIITVGPSGVPGDYNGNGVVDGADYVVWRNGGPLQNEVDTPGTVNAADYTEWRARFGNTSGSGSSQDTGAAVPEPHALSLAMLMIGSACLARRRRARAA